jgi:hypothetical protein
MMYKLRLFVIVLITALSSCGYNDITTNCENMSLLNPLPATADFTAAGTIIITSNNQKHKINFFWEQAKQQYKIGILGPLGIPIAEITGNDLKEQIRLVNEDEIYNLKEFMQTRLDYYISPKILRKLLLDPGYITNDVKITAVDYSCAYAYKLPNKITLELLSSDLALNIRVENWQL